MPGRALLCTPVLGQSCYTSWVLTMSMLEKPLLGAGRCPALFLLPTWAAWEGEQLKLLLGGSPAESLPPWAHGRWGRWEHVAASPSEASLEIACVWAGCRLLCPGTAESVGKLLRRMYRRTEVNKNLPEQNLRKVKRQACNDASSLGWMYVLCLK